MQFYLILKWKLLSSGYNTTTKNLSTPVLNYTEVQWQRPPSTLLKLNTDGSALHNAGKIEGVGILRDFNRDMIYAFTVFLGSGTNNHAETLAATHGLQWCVQFGYKKIILEVDSKLLTK